MKKTLQSLMLAIVAMLMMPSVAKAEAGIKWKFMNGTTEVTDFYNSVQVTFYQNAIRMFDSYTDPNYATQLSEDLVGQTYYYRTEMGHTGSVTIAAEGNTIELQLRKVTVTAKDQDSNPLNGVRLEMYAHGRQVNAYGSTSTNSEGQCSFYVLPDANYAYKASYYGYYTGYTNYELTDAVDVTNDAQVNLVFNLESQPSTPVVTNYLLQIVPRYGQYPLKNMSSSNLYPYSEDKGDLNSISWMGYNDGYWSIWISPGSYMLQDPYGVWSDEIKIVNEGKVVYLDYYKVTFTSKNSDPNMLKEFNINGQSMQTDGKGQVDYYLQPGTYTYNHAGTSKEFTVGKQDMTIDVTCYKTKINVVCSDPSQLNSIELQSGDGSRQNLSLQNGSVETVLQPGDYKLYYNGMLAKEFTADANKTVDVKLYSVKFTRNVEGSRYDYVYFSKSGDRNSYESLNYNRVYYYPEGNYFFTYNDPWSGNTRWTDVNLNGDKTFSRTLYKLTVNVADKQGAPAGGISVSVYRGTSNSYVASNSTDDNGQFVTYLDADDYRIVAEGYDSKDVTITADKVESLTVPTMVHFNVTLNGEPYTQDSYHFYLYAENHEGDNINVTFTGSGKAQARLDTDVKYGVMNYQGVTTITEGSTLALGTISVNSTGSGLAFPQNSWNSTSTYQVVVGAPMRLAAVPVGAAFTKWVINGQEYTDPMIDFKTKTHTTTATAVFGGTVPSKVRTVQADGTIDYDDNYINLPQDVEGTANIFTLDGKQVKSIGVIGDKVGIYDLPTGAYIMSLKSDAGIINARFLKK